MNLKIIVPKMAQTIESLGLINREMVHAVRRGLQAWSEETMTAARRVTPVDTGALRGSLHIKMSTQGMRAQASLGAGGPAAPYALIVHEKVGNVRWRVPGTGAKYLENPINERMHLLDNEIAAELNKLLARAVSGR